MEKPKVKKASRTEIREYNKTLIEITRLQTQLERAERKARRFVQQLYH